MEKMNSSAIDFYMADCVKAIDEVADKILKEVHHNAVMRLDSPSNSAADRDINQIDGVVIGAISKDALYI